MAQFPTTVQLAAVADLLAQVGMVRSPVCDGHLAMLQNTERFMFVLHTLLWDNIEKTRHWLNGTCLASISIRL